VSSGSSKIIRNGGVTEARSYDSSNRRKGGVRTEAKINGKQTESRAESEGKSRAKQHGGSKSVVESSLRKAKKVNSRVSVIESKRRAEQRAA
jgi:hypothetical protein